jgi:hypothetical protein
MENANSAAQLIRKLLSEICPEDVCKDKICHVIEAGNMHDRCRETVRSGGAPLPFEEFCLEIYRTSDNHDFYLLNIPGAFFGPDTKGVTKT